MWFSRKKDSDTESIKSSEPDSPVAESSSRRLSRSNSIWITKKPIVEEPEDVEEPVKDTTRARPTRSMTMSSFWPSRMNTKEEKELPQRPGHQTAKSDTMVATRGKDRQASKDTSPARSHTSDSTEGTFSSLSFRIPIIVSLIIFPIRSSDNDTSTGVASECVHSARVHHK